MNAIQNTLLKSRLLALIFILLNTVCSAAPSLNNTFGTKAQNSFQTVLQMANNIESEEAFAETSTCIINHRTACSNSNTGEKIADKKSGPFASTCKQVKTDFFIKLSTLLPAPRYYNFLFRYNLF
jgi:hypothetical protein